MAGFESKPSYTGSGDEGGSTGWEGLNGYDFSGAGNSTEWTDGGSIDGGGAEYSIYNPDESAGESGAGESGAEGSDEEVIFESGDSGEETGGAEEETIVGGAGEEEDDSSEEETGGSEKDESEKNREKLENDVEGIIDNIGQYRPIDIINAAKAAGVSLPSYRLSKLKEHGLSDPDGSGLMDLMRIAANFSQEAQDIKNKRKPKEEGAAEEESSAEESGAEESSAEESGAEESGAEESAEESSEEESSEEESAEESSEEESADDEAGSEEEVIVGGGSGEEGGSEEESAEEESSEEESGSEDDDEESGEGDDDDDEEESGEGGSSEEDDDSGEEGGDEGGESGEGGDEGGEDSDEDDDESDEEDDESGEDDEDDDDEEESGEGGIEEEDDEEEESSAEEGETERKKFWTRGRKIVATVAAVVIGGLAAFGIGSAIKKNNDAKAARDAMDNRPSYTDMFETTSATTTENIETTTSTAETGYEAFSHEGGNWSIGLFADQQGENSNPDKKGAYNIAPATVLERFHEDGALDTAEGQQEFKDTLSESWKDQAGSIAMVARALSAQGDSALLPDSLKGMSGEQMEAAIVSNENGAYDDMCSVLDRIMENATVEKTTLNGNYHNFYMKEYDESKLATKDNIDLVATEKNENGSIAYIIKGNLGDVDYELIVKDECTQIVFKERIPDIPYTPPETTTTTTTTPETTTTTTTTTTETTTTTTDSTPETTPTTTNTTPETTTTTTTSSTPETTTTTTTSSTPETTTTTTTQDVSKHEDALRDGQGGNVTPAQEGTRVTENRDQADLNGTTTTEAVNPAAQNADDTTHAGDVNRTPENQQQQDQRDQQHQEQQNIDKQRSTEVADLPPINDLSNGF